MPYFVAEVADALEVAVRRDEDAVGAGHRLEEEGRDVLRPFELDDLFDIGEREPDIVPAALHAVVRIGDVDDTGHPWLRCPPARIAREHHRPGRGAVIRAIPREHLVAAGVLPRHLDRVLVGLGAAVGEEERVDVAGRDRGELLAEERPGLGRHEGIGVREGLGLLLDGADDPLVAVADVDAHQLAVEVEVALALGGPEPAPFGAGDRDRVHLRLRRPFVERMRLRQRNEFG